MKIFQIDMLDSNVTLEVNESKVRFADFLIESVAPLFYEEIRKKQKQYSMKKAEFKSLNENIDKKKNSLLIVKDAVDKETLKKEVLILLDSIDSVKLTEQYKPTIQMMLRTIDKKSAIVLKKWITFLQKISKQQKKIEEK